MDIEANSPRGCFLSSSTNSSREMSVNSVAFSMDYAECIQAQSGNLAWAEQVEKGELQDPPSLSYVPLETVPLEFVDDPVYVPHCIDTNNTLSSPNLEPLVILYQAN